MDMQTSEIERHLALMKHFEQDPGTYTPQAHSEIHKKSRRLFEALLLSLQEDEAPQD